MALILDPRVLGLERRVVQTELGPVTVHLRRGTSSAGTATGTPTAAVGRLAVPGTAATGTPAPPSTAAAAGAEADADADVSVLLHGAAGSWTTWTPLIAEWDRRDAGRTRSLLMVDFPGWGDSPWPHDDDSYTIEALGRIVVAVADAVFSEAPRYRLYGHSLGGFVALHIAAARPERVARVDLVSAVSFAVIDSGTHPLRALFRFPSFMALLQGMRFLALLPGMGRHVVAQLDRIGFMPWLAAPLFDRRRNIHPSVLRALGREIRPRAFALAAARAARYPARTLWPTISCPVYLVYGDHDVFVADTDPTELSSTIATLRRTRLEGTGHFAHIENLGGTLAAWDGDERP